MECSHRELCRYDWLSSQGFATICDVNCCPLQVTFEFVYCWNPLNPQITGGWKECDCHCAAATVEFQSFCWSLTFSCSQHDDLYSFSDLFPTDCFSFIPSSHYFSLWKQAGNLSEISFLRISVWKKTCCLFIKTRRWIIHHTSPPSGPFSSISWTERDRKT